MSVIMSSTVPSSIHIYSYEYLQDPSDLPGGADHQREAHHAISLHPAPAHNAGSLGQPRGHQAAEPRPEEKPFPPDQTHGTLHPLSLWGRHIMRSTSEGTSLSLFHGFRTPHVPPNWAHEVVDLWRIKCQRSKSCDPSSVVHPRKLTWPFWCYTPRWLDDIWVSHAFSIPCLILYHPVQPRPPLLAHCTLHSALFVTMAYLTPRCLLFPRVSLLSLPYTFFVMLFLGSVTKTWLQLFVQWGFWHSFEQARGAEPPGQPPIPLRFSRWWGVCPSVVVAYSSLSSQSSSITALNSTFNMRIFLHFERILLTLPALNYTFQLLVVRGIGNCIICALSLIISIGDF